MSLRELSANLSSEGGGINNIINKNGTRWDFGTRWVQPQVGMLKLNALSLVGINSLHCISSTG